MNRLTAADRADDPSEALSLQVIENVIDDPEGRAKRSCNFSILILPVAYDRAAHFLVERFVAGEEVLQVLIKTEVRDLKAREAALEVSAGAENLEYLGELRF